MNILFWKTKDPLIRVVVRNEVRLKKIIQIPFSTWTAGQNMDETPEAQAARDALSDAISAATPDFEGWDEMDIHFEHYEAVNDPEEEESPPDDSVI